jgi:uroporphyrinogen III methyltransferase/synthase
VTPALLSTRPGGRQDPLVGRLEAVGWRVHAVPTVATEPLDYPPPDLDRFDWVAVTSAEGARALLERTPPGRARWAAVGPATATALARFGVSAEVVPEERRGVRLADAIAAAGGLAGRRVLLARADAAATDLPRALRAGGAVVEELAVYHTVVGPESSRLPLAAALADPGLAAAVVCSGSAVRGLLRLAPAARRLPLLSIGPATSAVARGEGMQVVAEAASADLEALVEVARVHLHRIQARPNL